MESYSLWRQGRTPDGRFSSMRPHACPGSDTLPLGTVEIAGQALSAIAQFGTWYELHKGRVLAEAQFEERRLQWLDSAVDQWIAEHRAGPGIITDVTLALATETDKIISKLAEHDPMDVPQVLLLKVGRVADYFDQVNEIWSQVLRLLAASSSSAEEWRVEFVPSDQVAKQLIDEARGEVGSAGANWLIGALGVAAHLVPVFGPTIGRGMIGGAVAGEIDRRAALKRLSKVSGYPQLIRLTVAAEQLLARAHLVQSFLDQQELPYGTHLYAVEAGTKQVDIVLGPETARPWYKRMFGQSRPPQLRALAAPAQ